MNPIDAKLLAARRRLGRGGDAATIPSLARAAASSDDLWIGASRRLVRAALRADDDAGRSRCIVDLRDSSPAATDPAAMSLDLESVRLATAAAFADALGLDAPGTLLLESIVIQIDDTTWVGGRAAGDVDAQLFGIARVFDAIRGALALAWPDRARAGSCSLGAIVTATDDAGRVFIDVVPGGRGAGVDAPGDAAWPGPVIPAGVLEHACPVDVQHRPRTDSGGGGARIGGDGVVARYSFAAPTRVRVALDRIKNPPHGLDRAGPPLSAELVRVGRDAERTALSPWLTHELQAGECIEVLTAGGAGHGFPGWGIEFDWE